ncbi:MAG TPA: NAD(P)-dependent oxidoreductase [Anaerolineae bacterium]|nr:NAD(P)-dependent oxidoreductase [Anaerolineae bacterium]HMR63974.1 NAD(P)-dependent oxidoreductase [Anaerolineae bacterium]
MTRPGMIITGAAGFVGRCLLEAFQPDYEIYAIDRRHPRESNAPQGAHIHWFQADISQHETLCPLFNFIKDQSNIDFLLHLAGYYDFSGDDHPEYRRSNIEGMHNVVEMATVFNLKRFIFTSSVAACPFPTPGEAITEATAPTGTPPYSRSKRAGEEMLWAHRTQFPVTIVRLAAVFTDWCEYEPLSHFLKTWFSGRWEARIMGGRGAWAIPYIHMHDLMAFFQQVVEASDRLERFEILQGSPCGATTVIDLYRGATYAYYGQSQPAVQIPKLLARAGILMREQWGRLNGTMPFERSWMGEYIDLQLTVDASRTHYRLNWSPRTERSILRRIPVIVENLRNDPETWDVRHRQRKASQMIRLQPI